VIGGRSFGARVILVYCITEETLKRPSGDLKKKIGKKKNVAHGAARDSWQVGFIDKISKNNFVYTISRCDRVPILAEGRVSIGFWEREYGALCVVVQQRYATRY
jgi:hypothetical protein